LADGIEGTVSKINLGSSDQGIYISIEVGQVDILALVRRRGLLSY
jgi:hypothetical protein